MCAKKKLLSFNLELFSQSTKIKSNNRNFASTMKLRIPPEPEEAIKITAKIACEPKSSHGWNLRKCFLFRLAGFLEYLRFFCRLENSNESIVINSLEQMAQFCISYVITEHLTT